MEQLKNPLFEHAEPISFGPVSEQKARCVSASSRGLAKAMGLRLRMVAMSMALIFIFAVGGA